MRIFDNEAKNELFLQKGAELKVKTNGRFRVEEDKNRMDICLRGLIYESDLVAFLQGNNVTKITIRTLEEYINKVQGKIDVSVLSLALDLYKMLRI